MKTYINRKIVNSGFCGVFLFTLNACTTTIETSKAITSNTVHKGVKYHLPADIFTIKTKETKITTRKIDECINLSKTFKYIYEIEPVEIETIPDTSHFYTLSLSPGWFSTDTLTITKSQDKPLLKKIDFHSDGKSGEIAVDSIKTIATIAGAYTGIGSTSLFTPRSENIFQDFLRKANISNNTNISESFSNNNICQNSIDPRLNRIQNYAINKSNPAKEVWANIIDIKGKIKNTKDMVTNQLSNLNNEKNEKAIKNIKEKLAIFQAELKILNTELEKAKILFVASVKSVASTNKLGSHPEEKEHKRMFHTDEVLTSTEFQACLIDNKKVCKDNIQTVFNTYKELHFGITLDPAFDSNISTSPFKASTNNKWVEDGVYTRDSIPYKYTIYSMDNLTTKSIQSQIIHLFSKDVAPTAIKVSTANIGDNKVLMNFTDKGMLLDVKIDSASKALEIAGATSRGATSALDSFDSSIGKISEIKDKQYQLATAKIDHEIAISQSKLSLLSEELSYEGALASQDKIIEKSKLNKEIDYLK